MMRCGAIRDGSMLLFQWPEFERLVRNAAQFPSAISIPTSKHPECAVSEMIIEQNAIFSFCIRIHLSLPTLITCQATSSKNGG